METRKINNFGFIESSTEQMVSKLNQKNLLIKRHNALIEKWMEILPKLEQLLEKDKQNSNLKKRIYKGVADCLRGQVWQKLAGIQKFKNENKINFNDLIKSSKDKDQIDLDITRTYPSNEFFKTGNVDGRQMVVINQGQQSLKNVLIACSNLFQSTGYCQGMNFIAGMFVIYMNDEESFLTFACILKNYQMQKYFTNPGYIKIPIHIFEQLLKKYLPKISLKLQNACFDAIIFAVPWFMTLFSNNLPFKLVTRIIDIFLYEGMDIIYKVALAIMKCKEKQILEACGMEQLSFIVKNFDEEIFYNDDKFIKICLGFKFKKNLINQMELLTQ